MFRNGVGDLEKNLIFNHTESVLKFRFSIVWRNLVHDICLNVLEMSLTLKSLCSEVRIENNLIQTD